MKLLRALYEDACLYVVPRSHNTPRTPNQRSHSNTLDAPKDPMDMPGAIQVVIKRESNPIARNILTEHTIDSWRDRVLQLKHPPLRHLQPQGPTCNTTRVHGQHQRWLESRTQHPAA
jgi:hypothetical protein